MCAVGNRFISREDAVQDFPRLQVDHIKAHMIAEADVGDPVLAIHGVRENPSFAHVLDLPDHPIGGRVEDRQRRRRTEIHPPPVQAHDAVVGLRSDVDSLDELAVLRVDDEDTATSPEYHQPVGT